MSTSAALLRPMRRARTRRALAGAAAVGAIVIPSIALADDAPTGPPAPSADDPSSGETAEPDDTQGAVTPVDGAEPDTTEPAANEPATTTTTAPTTTLPPVVADLPPSLADEPSAGTDPVSTTTTTTTTTIAPPPIGLDITVLPDRLQHILATIRYLESRNTYDIPPNKGNASGAYQFIESTWQNYGGYQHAYLAPPHVQDARAAEDVQIFLDRFDGDVSMVPVMWYFPRAVREPALMDVIPMPQHGNKLTIREYQTRWLEVFTEISGEELPPLLTPDVLERRNGTPPVVPEQSATRSVINDDDGEVELAVAALDDTIDVALSYPVLGPSRLASLDCANDNLDDDDALDDDADQPDLAAELAGLCVDEAPGVVFGVKLQPVLAAADGVVTDVDDEPGTERPIAVTITSPDGTSIEYRGFNDDSPGTDDGAAPDHLRLSPLAEIGRVVRAGQVIGFMGDSDPLPPSIRADVPTDATETLDPDAAAPHIRLTITDATGAPVDAVGPLLDARARESCRVGIGGWSSPPADGVTDEVTIETTDRHDDIDSQWVITPTGQVVATGWAAMINPVELCDWVPADPYGPGANGSIDWLPHWLEPYDLPTTLWVDLALRTDEPTPDAFVLPG